MDNFIVNAIKMPNCYILKIEIFSDACNILLGERIVFRNIETKILMNTNVSKPVYA